nr:MAG TPA: hypothetical protein [Caudoviricetes sp.]
MILMVCSSFEKLFYLTRRASDRTIGRSKI